MIPTHFSSSSWADPSYRKSSLATSVSVVSSNPFLFALLAPCVFFFTLEWCNLAWMELFHSGQIASNLKLVTMPVFFLLFLAFGGYILFNFIDKGVEYNGLPLMSMSLSSGSECTTLEKVRGVVVKRSHLHRLPICARSLARHFLYLVCLFFTVTFKDHLIQLFIMRNWRGT